MSRLLKIRLSSLSLGEVFTFQGRSKEGKRNFYVFEKKSGNGYYYTSVNSYKEFYIDRDCFIYAVQDYRDHVRLRKKQIDNIGKQYDDLRLKAKEMTKKRGK